MVWHITRFIALIKKFITVLPIIVTNALGFIKQESTGGLGSTMSLVEITK